jgi:hypothetical protein
MTEIDDNEILKEDVTLGANCTENRKGLSNVAQERFTDNADRRDCNMLRQDFGPFQRTLDPLSSLFLSPA